MGTDLFQGRKGARILMAFLGSQGCKTHLLRSAEQLTDMIARVFNVSVEGSLQDIATRVEDLGKKRRRELVTAYASALSEPTDLWPDGGLARKRIQPGLLSVPTSRGIGSHVSMVAPTVPSDLRLSKKSLERMMAASHPVLIDGTPFGIEGSLDIDPAKLLRTVVSAIISGGQAHLLYEFPELLAFFGARNPAPRI